MAQEALKGKPGATAAPATGGAPASGSAGWLPVIVVLVAVPVLSFVMAEYVLFPRLEKRLAAAGVSLGAGEAATGHREGAAAEPAGPVQTYEFRDVVSNLAGAMKSRYIKVSFTAYGTDPKFTELIAENRARLLDTTLGVLGSLSLADMEDAAIKDKVRTSLVQAYQTVLGRRIIEEVYFSEFVIQ